MLSRVVMKGLHLERKMAHNEQNTYPQQYFLVILQCKFWNLKPTFMLTTATDFDRIMPDPVLAVPIITHASKCHTQVPT